MMILSIESVSHSNWQVKPLRHSEHLVLTDTHDKKETKVKPWQMYSEEWKEEGLTKTPMHVNVHMKYWLKDITA